MSDLINYRELSRKLADNTFSIKKGITPKRHEKQVELLHSLIRFWEQECAVS